MSVVELCQVVGAVLFAANAVFAVVVVTLAVRRWLEIRRGGRGFRW